jgi:V-type H+-transporting ATPase subunit a
MVVYQDGAIIRDRV